MILGAIMEGPSGFEGAAIMRTRPYRVDELGCEGEPNSTGRPARTIASGSLVAAANELRLQALQLPAQSAGYFVVSRTSGFTSQPGGIQGDLCLGGSIGRLTDQIFQSGIFGTGAATLDLNNLPQPMGAVQVMGGETWYAQAWYRDAVAGSATSNFTSSVSVSFL